MPTYLSTNLVSLLVLHSHDIDSMILCSVPTLYNKVGGAAEICS